MAKTKVLSVGGSIVVPEKPDTEFLTKFVLMTTSWLSEDKDRRLILVVGGGGPARVYQNSYREILSGLSASQNFDNSQADWIGIMATRLNAELLKAAFGSSYIILLKTSSLKVRFSLLLAGNLVFLQIMMQSCLQKNSRPVQL